MVTYRFSYVGLLSSVSRLFRWDFPYTCAAVDKILTDSAWRGRSEIAELLVGLLTHITR